MSCASLLDVACGIFVSVSTTLFVLSSSVVAVEVVGSTSFLSVRNDVKSRLFSSLRSSTIVFELLPPISSTLKFALKLLFTSPTSSLRIAGTARSVPSTETVETVDAMSGSMISAATLGAVVDISSSEVSFSDCGATTVDCTASVVTVIMDKWCCDDDMAASSLQLVVVVSSASTASDASVLDENQWLCRVP